MSADKKKRSDRSDLFFCPRTSIFDRGQNFLYADNVRNGVAASNEIHGNVLLQMSAYKCPRTYVRSVAPA